MQKTSRGLIALRAGALVWCVPFVVSAQRVGAPLTRLPLRLTITSTIDTSMVAIGDSKLIARMAGKFTGVAPEGLSQSEQTTTPHAEVLIDLGSSKSYAIAVRWVNPSRAANILCASRTNGSASKALPLGAAIALQLAREIQGLRACVNQT